MKLQMHSLHFTADQKLLDFIQKKADKLETFFDRILDGEVFLRIDKGDHSKENKMVEIKLNIPGNTLFAKEHAASFEAATDSAIEALRRQLKKHKEKNLTGF
ncbi:ribosome hibernation-promoting factor, HPF/YfiA family [Chondrinema litorale]|uniref:ribosome hibernation-promoting factor, HPF/YfiA family n=1 Tax=Chondrinema litorale TaxID=2994555 RepID=UPI002544CF44|nr:ribosome-associated translation inhibitor RaiA [Chondrinema litorale]UZR94434.1 ribosome-associated translation inhibitor RaiA [Chondrinema litorale]